MKFTYAPPRIRVQRFPISARPRGNLLLVRRVRVHADDHRRPLGVAVGPRRAEFFTRLAAPSIGYKCMVECIVGNLAACSTCSAMLCRSACARNRLPIPLQSRRVQTVEHALQHRMRNRSYQIQRRLLEATDRLEHLLRLLGGPGIAPHHPHIFLRCRCSGNGGPGGTVRKAKNPYTSFGASTMKSLHQRIISAASSSGHSIGPA